MAASALVDDILMAFICCCDSPYEILDLEQDRRQRGIAIAEALWRGTRLVGVVASIAVDYKKLQWTLRSTPKQVHTYQQDSVDLFQLQELTRNNSI
jgi:hypothetical protein